MKNRILQVLGKLVSGDSSSPDSIKTPKPTIQAIEQKNRFVMNNILLIVFLPAVAFFSLLFAIILKCYFSGELSSWVQATGTILAIFSGFLLVELQTKNQQKKKREEELRLAETACLLTDESFDLVCARLNNAWLKNRRSCLQMYRTTEMINAMKEFQITQVSVVMLHDFIQIRSQLFSINKGINNFWKKEEEIRSRDDLESSFRVLCMAIESWKKLDEIAKIIGVNKIGNCPIDKYPELKNKLDKVGTNRN